MKTPITNHLTLDLMNQNFDNVLSTFFDINKLIQCNNNNLFLDQSKKNYVTIRLVTVLEQFFRKIVEEQIENDEGKLPNQITIQTQDIDKIKNMNKGGGDCEDTAILMADMQ